MKLRVSKLTTFVMNVPSLPTDQGTTDNLPKIQTCHAPGQEP